mmetsp:Transcript_89113/g.238683  ORF Transcript_89113/g.238683 Transcript_89113/m.238683 type:complete len:622 (-) Transcript_89113:182-2047(-)
MGCFVSRNPNHKGGGAVAEPFTAEAPGQHVFQDVEVGGARVPTSIVMEKPLPTVGHDDASSPGSGQDRRPGGNDSTTESGGPSVDAVDVKLTVNEEDSDDEVLAMAGIRLEGMDLDVFEDSEEEPNESFVWWDGLEDAEVASLPRPEWVPEELQGIFQCSEAGEGAEATEYAAVSGQHVRFLSGPVAVLSRGGGPRGLELLPLKLQLQSCSPTEVVWASLPEPAQPLAWRKASWEDLSFQQALQLGAGLRELRDFFPAVLAELAEAPDGEFDVTTASAAAILLKIQGAWIRSSHKFCHVAGAVATFEDGSTRGIDCRDGYAELNGWRLVSAKASPGQQVVLTWEMGGQFREWMKRTSVPFDVGLLLGLSADVIRNSLEELGDNKWRCGIPRHLPEEYRDRAEAILIEEVGEAMVQALKLEGSKRPTVGDRVVLASQSKKYDGILSPNKHVKYPVGLVERDEDDGSGQPYLVRAEGTLPTQMLGTTWYFDGDLVLAEMRAQSLQAEAKARREGSDFHGADRGLCNALAICPFDALLWNDLVDTRREAGLNDSAVDAVKRALQFVPNDSGLLARLQDMTTPVKSAPLSQVQQLLEDSDAGSADDGADTVSYEKEAQAEMLTAL